MSSPTRDGSALDARGQPPAATTIAELLSHRAKVQPHDVAYRFLEHGEDEVSSITFAELARRSANVAALLRSRVAPGAHVLLSYPPGLDFLAGFFGCLRAGMIAVPGPAPLPPLPRTLPRVAAIVHASAPALALCDETVRSIVDDATDSALGGLEWVVATGEAASGHASEDPVVATGDLAVLQFTSGSTTSPRGARLTHEQLLQNVRHWDDGYIYEGPRVGVNWLPHYHDLGLVFGLLHPFYWGFTSVLMGPLDFVQRPVRWLAAISRYQATHTSAPNFAYDLCSARVTDAERNDLDLSHWKMAVNAAEPVRADSIRRFVERFGPCGFSERSIYVAYGLSEGTCRVTGRWGLQTFMVDNHALSAHQRAVPAAVAPIRELVACGPPIATADLRIVEPTTRRTCASEEVGEIWVRGPTVARGYFHASIGVTPFTWLPQGEQGEPFLRTGDLGLLHEGELYVTGRLKDLIIIRGTNYFSEDIEWSLHGCHDALRPGNCAALGLEIEGAEALVIVAEVERRYHERRGRSHASIPEEQDRRERRDRRTDPVPDAAPASGPFDVEEVGRHVQRSIVDRYGIHARLIAFVRAGSLPKTSSGKLQRQRCRQMLLAGELPVVALYGDDASRCLLGDGSS